MIKSPEGRHEYLSPKGGISYGLEYPFQYKGNGASWVVFSAFDGWVLDRLDNEREAQRRCREINRIDDVYATGAFLINELQRLDPKLV